MTATAPRTESAAPPPSAPAAPSRKAGKFSPTAAVLLLCILLLAGLGIHAILRRSAAPPASAPIAAVETVKRRDLQNTLEVSAVFRPFQAISVHAKVAGYVKKMDVDVGDRVKQGDILAELESPELQSDLIKARAELSAGQQDVERARADYETAHLAFQRLTDVAKAHPNLVAEQDIDDAKDKDASMEGALGSARKKVDAATADVNKDITLAGYLNLDAPFAGTVTKRYADVGALIQTGISSNTQAMPVVDLVEDDLLRLTFPVPESAAALIHNGLPVTVHVDALNEDFPGAVSRFAADLNDSTRTMHTEVDVPNPRRRYTPGMFATVTLILQTEKNAVSVPIQAVATGDAGSTVLVVNAQDQIERRPVKVGLETSTRAQILSGIDAGERCYIGNASSVQTGQKVTPRETTLPAAE